MLKVLLTGGTSGIGLEIVKQLGKKNFIYILGRSKKKWNTIKLSKNLKKNIEFYEVNYTSKKIKSNFLKIIKKINKIDILLNNAGYIAEEKKKYNNISQSLYINTILPFKLLNILKDKINKSKIKLIINITSSLSEYGEIDPKIILLENGYTGYKNQKFLLNLLTFYFSKKFPNFNFLIWNPGYVKSDFGKKNKKLIYSIFFLIRKLFGKKTDKTVKKLLDIIKKKNYLTSSNSNFLYLNQNKFQKFKNFKSIYKLNEASIKVLLSKIKKII